MPVDRCEDISTPYRLWSTWSTMGEQNNITWKMQLGQDTRACSTGAIWQLGDKCTRTQTLTNALTSEYTDTHAHKPTCARTHPQTRAHTHRHPCTYIICTYTHTHTVTHGRAHARTSTHTNVQNRGNYIRLSACTRMTHPRAHMRIWPSPLPSTPQTNSPKSTEHSPPTV